MKKHTVIALALVIVLSIIIPLGPNSVSAQTNIALITQLQAQVAKLQATLLTLTQGGVVVSQTGDYEIQYYVPNYLPEYLKHPQHFFSGRDIKIVKKNGEALSANELSNLKLSRRNKNTKSLIFSQSVASKLSEKKEIIFTIPSNIQTGYYTLDFQSGGVQHLVPIEINGLTQAEKNFSVSNQIASAQDNSILSIKRLNCGGCYWESVLGINPNDENWGYFVGFVNEIGGSSEGGVVQTKDSWQTSQVFKIGQLTNPLLKNYGGDPKIAFTNDGKFTLSSIFWKTHEPYTGGFYQEKTAKSFPTSFSQTVVKSVPQNLPPDAWIVFDYPKMSIDANPLSPYFENKYVFASSVFLNDRWGQGIYTINGSGTITEKLSDYLSSVTSSVVGSNGEVYGAMPFGNRADNFPIYAYSVVRSLDGGQNFSQSTIAQNQSYYCGQAKTSSTSNRGWYIYSGPELAIDKQGRLYASWVKPKGCVFDSNFESSQYGYDFDVFVSHSDDHGVTWSQPVKVNDDNSGGDQGFANIKVDDNGVVYVAFLDHRENQNKSQFDVYLARSDNRGLSFSGNIKVNDVSIPNVSGGRDPGDYLDMLAVGKTKVFVSHPCVNLNYPQDGRPSDACVTTISKSPSITITSPRAGTTWQSNVDNNITWTSAGFPVGTPANIQIYTAAGLYYKGYNTGITVDSGSYTIPANTFPAGSYYFEMNAQTVNVRGDIFNVVAPANTPSVTITSPNGGETWPVGSSQTITWSTTGLSGSVLCLWLVSPDNATTVINLNCSNPGNDGTQTVTIPDVPTGNYKIRWMGFIEAENNTPFYAFSNLFQVTRTIPTVTSPQAGANWAKGSTQTVSWNGDYSFWANNIVAVSVRLEPSGTWLISRVPPPANKQLEVSIPTTVSAGSATIKVMFHSSSNTYEISGPTFNITDGGAPTGPDLAISDPATLTVTPTSIPAGGSVEVSGWTVKNQGTVASGNFRIGYYLSSDATINASDTLLISGWRAGLAPGATQSSPSRNSRDYPLFAAALAAAPPGAYYIGVLVDDTSAVSESNETNNSQSAVLTVTAPLVPALTVTSPNGGELILRGARSGYRIAWQELNFPSPNSYKINLSLKSDLAGTADRVLFSNLPLGVGFQNWFVPKDLPVGRYKLAICVVIDSNPCAYSDQSDDYFSIIEAATAESGVNQLANMLSALRAALNQLSQLLTR